MPRASLFGVHAAAAAAAKAQLEGEVIAPQDVDTTGGRVAHKKAVTGGAPVATSECKATRVAQLARGAFEALAAAIEWELLHASIVRVGHVEPVHGT